MNTANFYFDWPVYWLIPAFILGALISAWVYLRSSRWQQPLRYILWLLRTMVFTLLFLIILHPFIQQTISQTNKPKIVLALDNSASTAVDSTKIRFFFAETKQKLASKYDVKTVFLDASSPDSFQFNTNQTDLSALIKKTKTEKASAVILLSDGIANRGNSPEFDKVSFPLYTVGLGDTTKIKDAYIKRITIPESTRKNVRFPIQVEIVAQSYAQKNIAVQLLRNDTVLQSHQQLINDDDFWFVHTFEETANHIGIQKFTVKIEPLTDEQSTVNNTASKFVEIIDQKNTVLIHSPFAHPDVKAIRLALSTLTTLSVEVIMGNQKPKLSRYDVCIWLNAFDKQTTMPDFALDMMKQSLGNAFFISPQAQLPQFFIESNTDIPIQSVIVDNDQVLTWINDAFEVFYWDSQWDHRMASFPPLLIQYATFGNIDIQKVLFFQQIGTVKSQKPMVGYGMFWDKKMMISFATGTWTWRMSEKAGYDDALWYDQWIQKSVKYLLTTDQEEKFSCKPIRTQFEEGEEVYFDVKMKDESGENIYGNTVDLVISDADTAIKYTFSHSESYQFNAGTSLPSGSYQFKATTTIGGKSYEEKGRFLVNETAVERSILRADHVLLQKIATLNRGTFHPIQESEAVWKELDELNLPSKITTERKTQSALQGYTWLLLVVLLAGSEWFLRRYFGSY